VEVRIGVSEAANFEILHQLADLGLVQEEGGDATSVVKSRGCRRSGRFSAAAGAKDGRDWCC